GTAIRADLEEPLGFLNARFRASFSKTDTDFYNPFGATAVPGSLTSRNSLEISPFKGTKLTLTYTDERNHTTLVNNSRKTGSLEVKQFLTKRLSLAAGYDYRDFVDTLNAQAIDSSEVHAGLEWKPTSRFSAAVRRDENLRATDPTYPNETLLSAKYQMSDTVRLFLTQRFASAPITPIADLSSTGLSTPAGRNETSLGVEDKWSKYTSIRSGYLIENGINGADSYAVFGLVNRIPVSEYFKIDLGMERGQLLRGKDGNFASGSLGFSWLPTKNFRTSARYELRERGGLGQVVTTGAAGRISEAWTILGRFQYSTAAFQPNGTVDTLSPLSVNPVLSTQNNANQSSAALAWRSWRTDREGLLFSYAYRAADLSAQQTALPQTDRVSLLSTDGYYQPHRRVELYGKFAFSARTYDYVGADPVSTLTYLYQARAQFRIARRFDAAVEGRIVNQPDTSLTQSTLGAEAGYWLVRDLRIGVGYNFKSAQEIAANFLTNPVKQGIYFVLSSKLSNMFNLFSPGECNCAAPPVRPPPAPEPVAQIRVSAIAGAHDVCPGENIALSVVASGWLPRQTPAYQWFVDGKPVAGATSAAFILPTTGRSGVESITVQVSAGDSSAVSDPASVRILAVPPPTIQLSVAPGTIAWHDQAQLTASANASACATPPAIAYTASEGAINGATFDSTPMAFDPNALKPQRHVVQITATATDRMGQTATATAQVTVTVTPTARRLEDLIFPENSDRVNNCDKRLLLEELTPMLRNDPQSKVLLIGHRDNGEKNVTIDQSRVLNAVAVLSAGRGICPQLDLSRVLMNWLGTDQSTPTRPQFCGASTIERPGRQISASDGRAQFRRVEVWFVPGGASVPTGAEMKNLPESQIVSRGCPR
ncbi:MAG: hypothetical protein M3N93_07510, partial [Acidobacteriota bacterium]|nr:hypothetical protein [Acidobacteriota bacterium]